MTYDRSVIFSGYSGSKTEILLKVAFITIILTLILKGQPIKTLYSIYMYIVHCFSLNEYKYEARIIINSVKHSVEKEKLIL
jgi:hypothetical protein